MKMKHKLIALLTAAATLLPIAASAASAAAFFAGQNIQIGKIDKTSSYAVAEGLTYDDAYITDTEDNKQYLQMLSFNPQKSNLYPLVYTKYSGYGATTYDNAVSAEARGYDVKAAINCSFFGLTATSCNTYGGVNISDGRILQGSDSHPAEWVLAFSNDGRASLVQSKIAYRVTNTRLGWSEPVDCVNMCPEYTYDVIYYYDDLCGNKTDTNTQGVEVVFESINGTELAVGRTLRGRVAEIRNVSQGGDIGDGRFVLYAPDSSIYAERLRSFSVGDEACLTAEETVAESRSIMENCNSAFVTYGYHIVANGNNVTSSDGLGESYNTTRGQKTGLGVKPDGTVVLVSTNGREEEYPGLTAYEMADLLIGQGCVTGVNLDGGYSAQMVIEGSSGSLEAKTPMLRRVANSLLVVSREIPESLKAELDTAVAEAMTYLVTYEITSGKEALTRAVEQVKVLRDDSFALQADYRRAISDLYEAMDRVICSGYLTGTYSVESPAVIRSSADGTGEPLVTLTVGQTLTVTRTVGNFGFTRYLGYYGWVDLTSGIGIYSVNKKSPVITAPDTVYRGEDVSISWSPVEGASAYSYRVLELAGAPGGADETVGAAVITEGMVCDLLGVRIPAVSRCDGSYLKVAVCAEFPDERVWSVVYITTSALPFHDIERTHWGYDSAVNTYEKGYFSGVTTTRFDPNGTMTRAMMATVIYRMAGSPALTATDTTFADVERGSWYYDGVVWCQSQGIVMGVSENEFDPTGIVTREMAACFLQRYAATLGYGGVSEGEASLDGYADSDEVSAFAADAMTWCVQNGIIKGSGGRLTPRAAADRIQIATVIYNFDSFLEE